MNNPTKAGLYFVEYKPIVPGGNYLSGGAGPNDFKWGPGGAVVYVRTYGAARIGIAFVNGTAPYFKVKVVDVATRVEVNIDESNPDSQIKWLSEIEVPKVSGFVE